MEDRSFSGKTVIVTGAAAGIGRATALRFARGGANIAGWDVSDKAATTFETDISAAGGQALFQVVNVTDTASVEAAVNKLVEQWGAIDVLSITPVSCATPVDEEEWCRAYEGDA